MLLAAILRLQKPSPDVDGVIMDMLTAWKFSTPQGAEGHGILRLIVQS